jgi:hypothetical protein
MSLLLEFARRSITMFLPTVAIFIPRRDTYVNCRALANIANHLERLAFTRSITKI